MIDLQWIRTNPNKLDQSLAQRHHPAMSTQILELDAQHRQAQTILQDLQTRRNLLAKQIGEAKAKRQDTTDLQTEASQIKEKIAAHEAVEAESKAQLWEILEQLPNILKDDVPFGTTSDDNQLIHTWGQPRQFDFSPKAHDELLGSLLDFETAGRVSGARFVYLKGSLAKLHRALAHFMLEEHTNKSGYTEVNPPLLVRAQALYGTGQLPKFAKDLFRTTEGDFWLIPTSEVSLTNMVTDMILDEADLPLRFTAHTPCFRSEAGAAGRDTRGMIRQHQFEKVELVSITTSEQADAEHERMTQAAEHILQALELPYRRMLLCSGDTGATAQKTFDLEVWLPSQNVYREISSCSVCGDYQARRMNARYRSPTQEKGKSLPFVCTLNGSGIAVGRALIAVLENYQDADGSIRIPKALQPYMGTERIKHG